MDNYCRWKPDAEGIYWTDCGQAHQFMDDGTPDGNHHKYCPYCGRELKQEEYRERN